MRQNPPTSVPPRADGAGSPDDPLSELLISAASTGIVLVAGLCAYWTFDLVGGSVVTVSAAALVAAVMVAVGVPTAGRALANRKRRRDERPTGIPSNGGTARSASAATGDSSSADATTSPSGRRFERPKRDADSQPSSPADG
ncbi:hypothetical protein [Natrarchaeobius oligotrophus]|uniref:Uncharacterized protein n=1 Tax=Natrarchaeobius chitinivorans TaxID=1679083 RepID=A0A3N6MUU8_NATCH|nr:hypothetical protein [Natrarchaeobius chitinivorans]RQH01751.1 hypothetical protein EA472_05355 [Natrarchaeobius chitinivorans]